MPHNLFEILFSLALIAALLLFTIPTLNATFGAPFVPTPMRAVKKMIAAARLKKGTRVYDIGCGDGRIVYLAEKNGAKATGFELSPLVYVLSKIRKLWTRSKGQVLLSDFRNHNLSDAEVIFCYMMPESLRKYIIKFEKELRPGTRIISYAFRIGDWKIAEEFPQDPVARIAPIRVYEIGKT